jgi:hypothetical protein
MFRKIKRIFTPNKWERITKKLSGRIPYAGLFGSGKATGYAWVEKNQFGTIRGRVEAMGDIQSVSCIDILKEAISTNNMLVNKEPYIRFLKKEGYI